MLEANLDSSTIEMTPAAIQVVKDLMENKKLTDHALRIFISGGGCSGFQYGMAFEANIRPEDTTFEMDGIKLVVDEMSINYLLGSKIDYIDDPQGVGFKIDNPNIMSGCHCGNSSSSGSPECGRESSCCGN